MSFSIFAGVTVGAYRLITVPSLLIRNLVKFHLIALPKMPLAWLLRYL